MTTLTAITVIAISGCVAVLIGVFAILLRLFSAPRPKWTRDLGTGIYRRIIRFEDRPDGQTKVTLECGHQVIVHLGYPSSECKCEVCTRKASE